MGIFNNESSKGEKKRVRRSTPVKNFVLGASLAFNLCAYELYKGSLMRNPDAPQEVASNDSRDFLSRLAGR